MRGAILIRFRVDPTHRPVKDPMSRNEEAGLGLKCKYNILYWAHLVRLTEAEFQLQPLRQIAIRTELEQQSSFTQT